MTRILIVEDDAVLARCTSRLVRSVAPDAEIVQLFTAEAAIDALTYGDERAPFALVISDFNLAGVKNGGDVLDAVRTLRVRPAFLFVSSDERCYGRDAPWLQKPAEPRSIREAVLVAIDPPKVVIDEHTIGASL